MRAHSSNSEVVQWGCRAAGNVAFNNLVIDLHSQPVRAKGVGSSATTVALTAPLA